MALSHPEPLASDRFAGLWVRVISALILAGIGGAAIWQGHPWIDLLAAIAGMLMIGEWRRICGGWRNLLWLIGGFSYILASVVGFLYLRHDPAWGLQTAFWLVMIVAATDIGAYFAGKVIGGPKLAPRLSPGKTWAGLCGGVALAIAVAVIFALVVRAGVLSALAYGMILALVSQGGDLLESAVKRRFGFKDAGRVIPGHGGLLDRLDGLMAATLCLVLIRFLSDGPLPWH